MENHKAIENAISTLKVQFSELKKKEVEAEKAEDAVFLSMSSKDYEMAISALEKQIPQKPILCMNEKSGMFVDHADGHGEYKAQMNNWWRCPCCNEVVGQRVIAHKHIHDQRKKKYCENCGQPIDWSKDE